MQRRDFLRTSVVGAASYSRILGANDRVTVGLIGCGRRGLINWGRFVQEPDVNPGAVCDIYGPHMEEGLTKAQGRPRGYQDFRKLIEQKDLDAIIISTPDHWHALPTILACQAGKDVYVEKPLALTVREGQTMLRAARKYNCVVQVGSHQRSGLHYAQAVELIQAGKLGKVSHVGVSLTGNIMPGFGKLAGEPKPEELNWDLWLGPAPYKPYNRLRSFYYFRWFWDYSGGQTTNFGAHDLDIARWAMNVTGPVSVAGFGGRFALEDGGETPDVQEVVYKFADFVVNWSVREMNGKDKAGLEFHGTNGNLSISRPGFSVTAEKWGQGEARPVDEVSARGSDQSMHIAHIRNFLDCVKSRKRPNADIKEGHLTAVMCHLGNISTRLARSLRWDAEHEEIIGDREANQWLSRPYRAPWKLPDEV
jgi:myo-inositol 2-dehydrogenase / D-chiro-inositol 1-dehydrogenase